MKKDDFQENTRYTVTYKDENGKLRPANLYVMRLHNDGMVVRMTNGDGRLTKLKYEDVIKIVHTQKVPKEEWLFIPDAVLAENNWKDRKTLNHYSSSPRLGK